ncbi:unnamed protein product [Zymoseptoria tritici ST99CH_3D1]|nr:unnamed protein product [Zymoseptoria tritici ST99CH_3D1]
MDNTGLLQRVAALETAIFGSPLTAGANMSTATSSGTSPPSIAPASTFLVSSPIDQRLSQPCKADATPAPAVDTKAAYSAAVPPATTPQHSSLLELPKEIREEIYRLVVTQPDKWIDVHANGYARPALLQICKEIRSEAVPIFYSDTMHRFMMRTRDFDCSTVCLWRERSGHLDRTEAMLRDANTNWSPHWKNLLDWLKKFHARKIEHAVYCSATNSGSQQLHEQALVGMTFSTATDLKDSPWEVLERVLASVRPLLIASNPRWADEH